MFFNVKRISANGEETLVKKKKRRIGASVISDRQICLAGSEFRYVVTHCVLKSGHAIVVYKRLTGKTECGLRILDTVTLQSQTVVIAMPYYLVQTIYILAFFAAQM